MKARDLMTKNPECVTREDSVQRAASIMRDHDIGAVPVVDDTGSRRLVGIVTDRDIAVRAVAEGRNDCRVQDAMSSDRIATAREDDDVDRVMELMRDNKVRRIPVVGRNEEVVGMIAQADLAREARDEGEVERTVEKISEPGRR
ncbi:MAG TPA: CBS domain-containing protein [Longimicrobiales bacterium]